MDHEQFRRENEERNRRLKEEQRRQREESEARMRRMQEDARRRQDEQRRQQERREDQRREDRAEKARRADAQRQREAVERQTRAYVSSSSSSVDRPMPPRYDDDTYEYPSRRSRGCFGRIVLWGAFAIVALLAWSNRDEIARLVQPSERSQIAPLAIGSSNDRVVDREDRDDSQLSVKRSKLKVRKRYPPCTATRTDQCTQAN